MYIKLANARRFSYFDRKYFGNCLSLVRNKIRIHILLLEQQQKKSVGKPLIKYIRNIIAIGSIGHFYVCTYIVQAQ